MNGLERRVVSLETRRSRRPFARLNDAELDALMRAELRVFMAATPERCPEDVRAEVDAFLAADDAEGPQA